MLNIISIILNPINHFLNFKLNNRISRSIKTELFDHVIDSDMQFFEEYKSGELSRMFN